jgi:protein ImuA
MLQALAQTPFHDAIFSEQIAYEAFARLPRTGPDFMRSRQQPTFGNLRNPLMKNMASTVRSSMRRPASTTVQELKARLASFGERRGPGRAPLSFGIEAIDAALPGAGLSRGALHEISGASNDGAAAGFATALLARCAADGPVLWIARSPDLSAAGLAALGMDTARLLVVNAPKRTDALWAFEEALRTPAVAGVVAEIDDVDLTQSRRLQLAAETGGAAALLLRPVGERDRPSAARTRWHVAALPAAADGDGRSRRWRINLARVQGGTANEWCIEHRHDEWALADGTRPAVSRDLPAASGDRPVRAAG